MKFETKKIDLDDLPFGWDKIFWAGASSIDPGRIVQGVFGERMSASDMFMYIFRRFGAPSSAGDTFKSGGEYIFTTPMDGLYLTAGVKGSNYTSVLFGYLTTQEFENRLRDERQAHVRAWHDAFSEWRKANDISEKGFRRDEDYTASKKARDAAFKAYDEAFPGINEELHQKAGPLREEVTAALLSTANDLMRPTNIRDAYFNILGPFAGIEYDEETDTENTKYGPPVDYYEAPPEKS